MSEKASQLPQAVTVARQAPVHPEAGQGRCSGTHDARRHLEAATLAQPRTRAGSPTHGALAGRTPAALRVTSDLGPRRPSPRALCPPLPTPGPT